MSSRQAECGIVVSGNAGQTDGALVLSLSAGEEKRDVLHMSVLSSLRGLNESSYKKKQYKQIASYLWPPAAALGAQLQVPL